MIIKEKDNDYDCIESEYDLEDKIAKNWLVSLKQAQKYNKEQNNERRIKWRVVH